MEQATQKHRGSENLIPWKPGQSGNPGGKPIAARNALNAAFLKALSNEFNQNGPDIIARVARDDPATIVRALVALQPKEVELSKNLLSGLTDEQLQSAELAVRAILAAQNIGSGIEATQQYEPIEVVPTVSETG